MRSAREAQRELRSADLKKVVVRHEKKSYEGSALVVFFALKTYHITCTKTESAGFADQEILSMPIWIDKK